MPADYIIIGAGTSRLVLANRLSANPNTTVVMIGPGLDDRKNLNVTNPSTVGGMPRHLIEFAAGKLVGGTSMTNGLMFAQLCQRLMAGSSWVLQDIKTDAGATPEYHGRSGEIDVSYPPKPLTGSLYSTLAAAWEGLGVPIRQDANGGKVEGFTVRLMMVDRKSSTRASAATAFYYPVVERPNLHLVRGTALSLLWRDHFEGKKQVFTGVRYLDSEENLQIITPNPSGEVIIAAGALATPAILEASGVGSKAHLTKLGIVVRIGLPGVGENLQDQPGLTLSYIPKTPSPGALTPYAGFVTARDVFRSRTDSIAE